MNQLKGHHYEIHLYEGSEPLRVLNDNVDVEVRFDGGERYAATFFTLENLRRLFEKNEVTKECKGGLYFWASDMIIVRRLTKGTIARTVADLISTREFEKAFAKMEDTPEP